MPPFTSCQRQFCAGPGHEEADRRLSQRADVFQTFQRRNSASAGADHGEREAVLFFCSVDFRMGDVPFPGGLQEFFKACVLRSPSQLAADFL